MFFCCLASHGASGLKYVTINHYQSFVRSHPARGVWIEIGEHRVLPAFVMSRPARGEWIEIVLIICQARINVVSPHTW